MNWKNKEEVKEYNKKYYQANKEHLKDLQKEYLKTEKGKESKKKASYNYDSKHRGEKNEKQRILNSTDKLYRAKHQVRLYKYLDKRNGFNDVVDFDGEWMVKHIYTNSCPYCGETDWHKLGCNRLDNTKPHTKDNVEPCCKKCNSKLGRQYQLNK